MVKPVSARLSILVSRALIPPTALYSARFDFSAIRSVVARSELLSQMDRQTAVIFIMFFPVF